MKREEIIKGDPLSESTFSGKNNSWASDLRRCRKSGPSMKENDWYMSGESTIAVHAGTMDDDRTGAVGTPIYQTSTFTLGESEYTAVEEGHARDKFIYTRYGNPSQWAVQNKLAALERAESALVFSSGMAAITASVMAMLDRGAHVVASNELYGGTYNLFNNEFPTFGMSVDFVEPTDYDAIETAIKPNTQILYFEVLTNPLLKLVDIERLADIAHRHKLRLIVDATFATPIGCKSLELGADLVIHSCTKYLNGHSDLVAGCVMGSRKLVDMVWPKLLHYGGSLDPHAAFMLERGLKTLAIRMQAHEKGAFKLATYLESHPKTSLVRYPLLKSFPQYELSKKMLKNASGMISFTIVGGDQAAKKLISLLTLSRQATSLGVSNH